MLVMKSAGVSLYHMLGHTIVNYYIYLVDFLSYVKWAYGCNTYLGMCTLVLKVHRCKV